MHVPVRFNQNQRYSRLSFALDPLFQENLLVPFLRQLFLLEWKKIHNMWIEDKTSRMRTVRCSGRPEGCLPKGVSAKGVQLCPIMSMVSTKYRLQLADGNHSNERQ